ncbi:MAG: lipopolysaccharide assembly protein LapA domain-containing protein [Bacteroidota bacterium]
MVFTLIVVLALAVLSVIFALQNPTSITTNFFSLKMEGPLALFVLGSIGIGIVIGILLMIPSTIKHTITISRHRKHISGLEKSLEEQKAQNTKPPVVAAPASPTSPPALTTEEPIEAQE